MEQNPFTLVKTEKMTTLFVNSEVPPYKETPLNHYEYSTDIDGKLRFFRLYSVEYLQEESIRHSVMVWYPIMVKSHCVATMKQLIDSMKGASALIT